MKKFLKISLIVILIMLIGGYFFVQNLKKSALPDYNKEITITGLKDKVTVYRDSYGVPHIYAKNEHDLYMVVGYLSAQDRMWQMDLLRRVTEGRLSEIFGEKVVETDVILRKLNIPEGSKKLLPKLSIENKAPLDYFAAGVNLYIKNHKDNLPFEFKVLGYEPDEWKPEHSLNLVGFMAWNLELGYKMEAALHILKDKIDEKRFKEMLPDYDIMKTKAYPSFEWNKKVTIDTTLVAGLEMISKLTPDIFNGSNNWVVAGKKSSTGKPIFSNDMHLGLNIPGIWTRMHMNIEGKLNVTGVVLPGEPFVVAGHNDRIAWGMTNVMLDGADFYMETINPKDKSQYKFNGEWKNMEVRHEKIKVKGKDKPVEKTIYFTHRGPIFTQFDKLSTQPVSMHWIGNEETREIVALFKLSTAGNWDEFCNAIKGFQSVSQNIAYADVDGNIGLHLAGRLPKRKVPGFMFLPGDTDKYDWKEYVAFDSLPYEYNPQCGFVSSANNKSVNNSYPYYISEWYDVPYRIQRIRQMLTAKDKLSTEDIRLMLNDHHSVEADRVKPILLANLEKEKNWTETEKKAIKLLKEWNNNFDVELPQPLVYEQTMINLTKNLAQDEMGEELFNMYKGLLFPNYLLYNSFENNHTEWADNINTSEKETFQDILVLSFKQSVQDLTDKYGNIENIKWGNVHRFDLKHPLGQVKALDIAFGLNRNYAVPGSSNTVNPFSYTQVLPYISEFGASEKHIFNTENWDKSYSILPTGVSGIPASKHYCDQTEKYINGEVLPDYFNKEIVVKNAVYTQVFK